MLGSNLGKKVTAGVVQDEYKQFLKNKPDEHKKTLTPEERKEAKRVEMRRRGVFVKADDPDETPTILEKSEGVAQPMLFVLPEKPTLWKRTKKSTVTRKHKKEKKPKEPKKAEDPSGPSKKKKKTSKKEHAITPTARTPTAPAGAKTPVAHAPTAKRPSSAEPSTKSVKEKKKAEVVAKQQQTEEKPEEKRPEEKHSAEKAVPVVAQAPAVVPAVEVKGEEVKVAEEKSEEKSEEKVEERVEVVKSEEKQQQQPEEKQPEEIPVGKPVEKVEEKPEEKPEAKVEEKVEEKVEIVKVEVKPEPTPTAPYTAPPSEQRSDQQSTRTEPSKDPSLTDMKKAIPMAEKQGDAFDKLDDDEFEKMTSDADEKEMLKLAPRLLKVAKRHAAIEKGLSGEENEVLAKFFSGKQKLDAHVLAILDGALDKIIDYLQKNNCAVDEETKAVMKKRDKLKAAMMKEFLVSPQYLPKTWTAKFNEWKSEAEKQKNGVNWFRVCFSYPKHKSFDDGPEDTFGNFRRRHRGLLLGIVLGPGDVKSFEETKREDDCQGMFLDTRIIENAADTTTSSTMTAVTADRRSGVTDGRK